jgi:hypothetical protein
MAASGDGQVGAPTCCNVPLAREIVWSKAKHPCITVAKWNA